MSYTVPPGAAAPAPRPRPATVTWASYLLYGLAALQVISALMAIATFGAQARATEQAYADFPELRDLAGVSAAIGLGVGLVIAVLFAAGFVTLGVLDSKGKNAARIVTWVLAGIGVCCFGVGAAGSAANGLLSGIGGTSGGQGPDPAELQRAISDALPGWFYPATTTVNVLSLLASIAVIVLLALPKSNEFFRKPQQTWEPPVPGYPPVG